MKNKGLLLTTVIFFLLVNTKYFWEAKLGLYAFPVFLILVVIYLVLGIALVRQIYFSIKEKRTDKKRLLTIGLLTFVILVTFLRPFGIIDFDKFEGKSILIAESEGAANCMTTLKLKEDFTFKERIVCFGVSETKGNYRLQNDTIYFDNVSVGRNKKDFYKFAVVKPSKFFKDGKHYSLIRYKGLTDTIGHELWIKKNELSKFISRNEKSKIIAQ